MRSFVKYKNYLEQHFEDMQDIEFTIQENQLFLLQTRNGKRTTQAAVKIAVDMVKEILIDKKTAISRINPNELDQLLHPTFDPKAKKKLSQDFQPRRARLREKWFSTLKTRKRWQQRRKR